MKRALLAVALCLSACRKQEPWVAHDLWSMDAAGATKVEVPLATDAADPVGAEPSRVRGLRIAAGVRVSYRVDVGEEAFLSFIPLRAGTEGCRYRYRVAADEKELVNVIAEAGSSAPETVIADLDAYAGKTIELLLITDAVGARCGGSGIETPVWGSPRVQSRCIDCAVRPKTKAPLNVIFISFDAMRADAIGPRLTPRIEQLKAKSEVWTDVYSTFNATNPSFASTMTGFYGPRHGVYDLQTQLPSSFTTLAEILRTAGYRTGAIVSAQHLSDAASGLGQGFEDYIVAPRRYSAEMAADLAMEWLDERPSPFFLWLHFFDPHTPHDAPRPYATGHRPEAPTGMKPPTKWVAFRSPGAVEYRDPQLRAHEDLYDAEVAYLDRQIDRILDFLDSRGLLERSIVVLTSDHGENGRDDRVPFRHAGLWDATTHIPLIIHRPDAQPRVHHGLAQNIDILPTLLAMLSMDAPATDGVSLLDHESRAAIFAEHSHHSGAMVRDRDFLYNWSKGNPFVPDGAMLFDLRRDPRQQTNLASSRPEVVATYAAKLEAWKRGF
ncbi:MAG TPA: sulfatase [Thermoanaerobaculia bacterium]|jgi:arylsulfatase A-like enzyme|nr:sulfatase [Thermoanaerobaculia bacterium]